jgi:hypothetical protein
MSALQKPSVTVGMKKGLDAVQAEPADPATPNPYLEADRRNARPPKPVRVTIDLDADRYRTLQAFRGTQITAAAVFRAFLDELEDSNDLAGRISARIWAEKR